MGVERESDFGVAEQFLYKFRMDSGLTCGRSRNLAP